MLHKQNMRASSVIVIVGVLLVCSLPLQIPVNAQDPPSDLIGVKVAVYNGGSGYIGTSPLDTSMAALYWMYNWMNASVDIVNAANISDGLLEEYDLVAVPGGWADDYRVDLGNSGMNQIRSFVEEGGAYVGMCAGAFLACEETVWTEDDYTEYLHYGLSLFGGSGIGPIVGIADWPDIVITEISVNTSLEEFGLGGELESRSVMYYGGPYFVLDGSQNVTVLSRYEYNDEPAMVAFEYGAGRVFLSGPHPEWEEDSSRDGANWNIVLDDPDSEWGMMLKISQWLAPTPIPSTTPATIIFPFDTQELAIGGTGVILFAAIVVFVVRRDTA
jgi:glutamine amidotransferase-like uncharacterized protein